jgi:hypothetical protein
MTTQYPIHLPRCHYCGKYCYTVTGTIYNGKNFCCDRCLALYQKTGCQLYDRDSVNVNVNANINRFITEQDHTFLAQLKCKWRD